MEAAKLVHRATDEGSTAVVALAVDGGPPTVLGGRLVAVSRPPAGRPRSPGVGRATFFGSLGDVELDRVVKRALSRSVGGGGGISTSLPGTVEYTLPRGKVRVYVEVHHPPDELIIVGAGHVAIPLARIGALVGFKVHVLDDRPGFATRDRFPQAARVLSVDFDRPFAEVALHARSHLILVTRGHRYDYACLLEALTSEARPAYIGMIGSRRRVRATYLQLVADGIDPQRLKDIFAPIGLDIRAETPEEIAIAVAAELVLVRRGGSGRPLSSLERIPERFFGARDNPESKH